MASQRKLDLTDTKTKVELKLTKLEHQLVCCLVENALECMWVGEAPPGAEELLAAKVQHIQDPGDRCEEIARLVEEAARKVLQ